MKAKLLLVLAVLTSALAFSGFAPVSASAKEPVAITQTVTYNEGDDDPFDVTIGEDGKVVVSGTETDSVSTWNAFLKKTKWIVQCVSALATIIMVAILVVKLMQVAAAADDPAARKRATTGVLWVLIVTALLGAADIILALAYRAIS